MIGSNTPELHSEEFINNKLERLFIFFIKKFDLSEDKSKESYIITDRQTIIHNGKQYDMRGEFIKLLADENIYANQPLNDHNENLFKFFITRGYYQMVQTILDQDFSDHDNQNFKLFILDILHDGRHCNPRTHYYDIMLSLLEQIDKENIKKENWNRALKNFVSSTPNFSYTAVDIDKINEIVKLLLDKGADINHKFERQNSFLGKSFTNKNATVLDVAALAKQPTLKAVLKQHGAEYSSSYIKFSCYFQDVFALNTTSSITARIKGLETIAIKACEYLGMSAKAVNTIKANLFLALPITIMIAAVKVVRSFMENRVYRRKELRASVAEAVYDTGSFALQNVAGVAGAAVATTLVGGVAAPFVASAIAAYAVEELAINARPIVGKFTKKLFDETSAKLGFSTPSPKI